MSGCHDALATRGTGRLKLGAEPGSACCTIVADRPAIDRLGIGRPDLAAISAADRETLAQVTSLTVSDTPEVPLPTMLRHLRHDHGVRVLCCLGGPAVNAAMLRAGVVDEVFCTIAPKIHAGRGGVTMFEGAPYPADDLPRLDLAAIHTEDSEIYLRYRVRRDA